MNTVCWLSAEVSILTAERAYNPAQPRDSNGEWTSGGIGGTAKMTKTKKKATNEKSWKSFWDDFEFESDKKSGLAETNKPIEQQSEGFAETNEPVEQQGVDNGLAKTQESTKINTSAFDDMSLGEKIVYLSKKGEEWNKSLTKYERFGLEQYTGDDSGEMNDALRSKNGIDGADIHTRQDIEDATSALMKGKAPTDMTVLRGIDNAEFDLLKELEGEVYVAKGFTSTTIDPSISKTFGNKLLYISIPKGSPGAYVNSFSYSLLEHEYALPPNAKFRIESVTTNEAHMTYLGVHQN